MPHVHLGSRILSVPTLANRHVPTGVLAIADVIWFAIHKPHVQPARTDWQRVLSDVGAELAAG